MVHCEYIRNFVVPTIRLTSFSQLNHSLDSCRSSVLGNEDWKTVPWLRFEKDSLHYLFDIGFELATLLERAQLVLSAPVGVDGLNDLWSDCFAIFGKLEQWYNVHWAENVRQRQMTVSANLGAMSHDRSSESPPLFGSFWEATNLVYYWSFKLMLDDCLVGLSGRTPAPSPHNPSQPTPTSSKRKGSKARTAIIHGLSDTQLQQITNTSLALATDIVRSTAYFLADDTGWLGPQRLFFPIQRVMKHLAKVQSPLFSDARLAFMQLLGRLRSTCVDKTPDLPTT